MDEEFYNDAFFSEKDYERMINDLSINKIVVHKTQKNINGFLIYCVMPDKSYYITSLVGTDEYRIKLVKWLLKHKATRFYTHGMKKWGVHILEKLGFVKKGKGDPKEEMVEFLDDITKLDKYELIKA